MSKDFAFAGSHPLVSAHGSNGKLSRQHREPGEDLFRSVRLPSFRWINKQDLAFRLQMDLYNYPKLIALCRHFLTSLFLPTYEATYTAGYLLPTDDRYREHHDHIWIVLQFVE